MGDETPQLNEVIDVAGLYRERAHLLARLAVDHPSHIGYNDPAEPEWQVLTIDLPGGQGCWHIAPADDELFAHVRPTHDGDAPHDGHSTQEKYRRIQASCHG